MHQSTEAGTARQHRGAGMTQGDAFRQKKFGANFGWGFRNTAPFNDSRVQQAMSLITNRLALMELGWLGQGMYDGTAVMPASSGNPWSLTADEILSTPGWRTLNKNTGELETDMFKIREGLSNVYEKDPADTEAGLALLREAGLDPSNGQFPSFSMASATNWEGHAIVYAQTLREVGIDVELDVTDFTTFNEKRNNGTFESIQFAIFPSGLEPSENMKWWTTDLHFWNHGFEVPELDALFDQQKRETDAAKRLQLVTQFQRKIMEGVHQTSGTFFNGIAGVIREWVKNFPPPAVSTSYVYSFDRVWFDPREK